MALTNCGKKPLRMGPAQEVIIYKKQLKICKPKLRKWEFPQNQPSTPSQNSAELENEEFQKCF